ncbi:MAG: PolC-type DNA polymerase III [Oscillospiraceae bacterium]|nr:PolC-type DNA polymerase III [Oscillospiraceae bacterium]
MSNHPFYEMFDCCNAPHQRTLLQNALVPAVTIERERLHMEITIRFPGGPVAPVEVSTIERELAAAYGLRSVYVRADYPAAASVPTPSGTDKPAPAGTTAPGRPSPLKSLYGNGRPPKGAPMPMREVNLESGRVHIAGEVFGAEHRHIEKRGAWVLSFSVTDYTGSVRVSKFFPDAKEGEALCSKIKNGMYLHIRGHVSFNRYDGDLSLEPADINVGEAPKREDTAEEKRVELHLHTNMSALDGLTKPAAAVAQAAAWGHPAIAVTDHGVAHNFPDAYKAGQKHGLKVIFGLEGYFFNDCDDKPVVSGPCPIPLDSEFVAFDLETTGLNPKQEAMTEIGAVRFRGGEILDTFQTFVNPGKPIPYNITKLTGIKDSDVAGAPKPADALKAFLDFAGDSPLVAHNAGFDVGFLLATAERSGMDLDKVAIDTLPMAQALLPGLQKHRLNLVAEHLGLPNFNHHRAVDDAKTVAHMMEHFLVRLCEEGVETVDQITPRLSALGNGSEKKGGPNRHIILLAKNKIGLKNLYKLISAGHLHHYRRVPRIPKSLLMAHRDGLIIGSACEAGEVFSAILDGKPHGEVMRIAKFYDYLEIQPVSNNMFLVEQGKVKNIEALRDINREIVRLGEELDKPVVATGDVHFLHPEHEEYRRILLASKKMADSDNPLPLYLKSTDEMLEEFAYLGAAKAQEVVVKNPQAIAALCEDMPPLPQTLHSPKIEGSKAQLESLVYEKLEALYGPDPPNDVRIRVKEELDPITDADYDVIYMSAQKLVEGSLKAGYLVGSRGSVGSSIVAYLAGITEVNSLKPHYRCPGCRHADFDSGADYGCGADMPDAKCPNCGTDYEKDGFDIPFATFLGFKGDKTPDIDLNFSGEYQARSHKETIALFGADHVFRSGTVGTIAFKTAFGYVKKYLEERNRIVTRAEEARLSEGLVGVKRTTGQHPGGLVIIPQTNEISDFCPVQHPADDKDSGIITTHFEYKAMEDTLLKLDLLGHDDPSMLKVLQDLTGIDPRTIPLDDPETMSIFRTPAALGLPDDDPTIGPTGTIAVPEFGTRFTREMLNDTKPEAFDTLIRLSGFSHGTDVWLGNAKDLLLGGTASITEVIGCRDDIMLFLIEKGVEASMAFDIMESVRKGRGLKPPWKTAMEQSGVPQWYIESCQKIKYLFPKAHAVAYVMMAFRIAWFKVHRPLAFYSAYFTVRAKAFDAAFMCRGLDVIRNKINEINRNPDPTPIEETMLVTLEVCYEMHLRGYSFSEIDLYKSDALKFQIEGDTLAPPFTAVAGLGDTAAVDIVTYREDGPFLSVEDLLARCPKVSVAHIEQLKLLGVLDGLPDTSQVTLF